MKLNLLTVTSLLCGLFLLGSCAKDEPQSSKTNTETVDNGPRVNVPLQLDAEVNEFNDLQTPKSARAFNSPQSPVTVKDGTKGELDDDLNPTATNQKILSALRANFVAANPTIDVILHFECGSLIENVPSKMTYEEPLGRYRHDKNISLSSALASALSSSNGTVTVYTGGTSYDATTESFKVTPVMEEISLSSAASTPVNLPILYASTPISVKVTDGKLLPVSTTTSQLKPQGSLLLVTFRNNMDQDVTFDGITAVTNNYFGPNNDSKPALLKLKGSKNAATELTTEATKYTSKYSTAVDGGKAYTYFYKDFSAAQFTVARGGARSDKAVVFWGYKGDALPVASASSNKLDDNGLLINAATGLIHVYAKNPKIGGQVIARPNYSIAPIGGANFAPADGKAYTLNCEFYTQPRQALGYLDKGYLYKDGGTWKHHDVNAGGLTNDPTHYNTPTLRNVPLVSSGDANEVRLAGVTTSKGKMYMPDQAWLNLMSLFWPLEFSAGGGRFKDFSGKFAKGSSGYDYRAYIYNELLPYKATNDDTSDFSEAGFVCADYAKKDQDVADGAPGYAYRQLYISPRRSDTGAHPRSKYQTLVRYLTRMKLVDGGKYVTSMVIESLYLGKYFVGNIVTTPLYVEPNNATKPFTYLQESSLFGVGAEPTRGMVTRILINAKTVQDVMKKDAYLKPYSEVKTLDTADGIKLVHWGTVSGQWANDAMLKAYDKEGLKQLINAINATTRIPMTNRFYGYNAFSGGIYYGLNKGGANDDVRGLYSNFTYQPLRAYSTTYQGDDGKKPQQGL